ncbi:MAG: acyl-CoA dehydrogenase family protein [Gemmatimonadota bacterium]
MIDLAPVRAFLEPRHHEMGRLALEFGARELVGHHPASDDEARDLARRWCRALGERGMLAPVREQDFRACCVLRETLAAFAPLADAMFALQALGSTPIALAGSEGLRAEWLEPAIAGERIAAFAMTEPGAGSDVGAIATTAVRDGDAYVIDGTKTLISNAGIADFYVVFASTDPTAGTRGLSAFVVPADADGFRFVRPLIMSDPHPLGDIAFDACRIPASNRLGEEGDGFKIGMSTLDRLRPTVGAAACGMAARALEEALSHARERRQFEQPLAEFQIIQEKLGRMATELTAARLLVYRAAWERDGGADRTDLEAAMAKSFATETAQRVVDEAVQIVGGRGTLADHPVDQLYRAVRSLRIYEGTTEIQRLIVARHLLAGSEAT